MHRFYALAASLAFLLAAQVHAQTVVYSNLDNFSGMPFWSGTSQTIGSNIVSSMLADDIFYSTPGASQIGQLRFSVFNGNAANVTARPILRFFDNNGAGGMPGAYLGGYDFDPLTFTGGALALFTADVSSEPPVITDGSFWVGIAFDNNNGTTGATATQLENLGQGMFGPATIGSSADHFFVSNEFGNFSGNNPDGGFVDFGGFFPASFAWQFSTFSPVPEPSSLILVGVVALAFAGRARRMFGARAV